MTNNAGHEFALVFDKLKENDLLNVDELASVLRISPKTVRKWRYQGDIEAVKIGKRLVRFRWGDILKWLQANGVSK